MRCTEENVLNRYCFPWHFLEYTVERPFKQSHLLFTLKLQYMLSTFSESETLDCISILPDHIFNDTETFAP